MRGRGSSEAHRGRALDLWQAPDGAGEPLVCIATTFTFDAGFFETECLGRFLAMDTHPEESDGIAYLVEREEKLAGASVCVLVDRQHAKSKESMRWDVLPVLVPGAAQHAKLSLLCWSDRVRVIIGSGNLTKPGYRSNVEVFGSLDADREDGGATTEIGLCLNFLDAVLGRTLGDEAASGPRRRARLAVADVRRRIARWPQGRGRQPVAVFGGQGASVIEQIGRLWPSSSPPRLACVLSPFFDRARPAAPVAALGRLVAKRGERYIELYPPGETLPDGRRRVCMPRALADASARLAELSVHPISPQQDGETRPLHAKSLHLRNHEWDLLLFGSSNFTSAGLGIETRQPNFEANLVYLARAQDAASAQLARTWPKWEERAIDLDDESVLWEPAFEDEEEGGGGIVLPAAFREALYQAGPHRSLVLELDAELPREWAVCAPGGAALLASTSAGPGRHEIEWVEQSPPFVLQVEWRSDQDTLCTADWPVNVVDLAALPPPEELRGLSLDELIQVLASTRPLHESVGAVLRKRSTRGGEDDPALDPHKRVNTETFLLRRTKRMAMALEHLRRRLERPVCTPEALDWRLFGPLGALTLAQALERDAATPLEAAFFQAELALALARVQVREAAKGGLAARVIRERIRACIDQVEAVVLAPGRLADDAMGAYVRDAFEEARR